MDTQPNRVLSLFSGIGGMDMGFDGTVVVHQDSIKESRYIRRKLENGFVELEPHPFRLVFQNDILEGAMEVYRLNHPQSSSNYHTTSIYDLLKSDFVFPEADVILGGFPCQDFSHCGKRGGFHSHKSHNLTDQVNQDGENSRGSLYRCFVDVVARVHPKIFVAENVYGLLTMRGDPIQQIIQDFTEVGYDVSYQVVDCNDYGIPQTRRRVIIMGISQVRDITELPVDWNCLVNNQIQCPVGKYLSHLREPEETDDISQRLYSKAKRLSKGQGQKEINLQTFAPTIRAEHHGNIEFRRHQPSLTNPAENGLAPERRLTLREAGLIQTFPPDYIFTQKKTMKSYKYIGNAVPPLLGYLIAEKVDELLRRYF